jgi:thioredoxin-like negative regulator of GroEL
MNRRFRNGPGLPRTGGWNRAASAVAAWFLLTLCFVAPAGASPPRGSTAPPIELKALDGTTVSTVKLAPRTFVLVFGEMTAEKVRDTCGTVLDVVADPRLAGEIVTPILIIAQDAPAPQLKEESAKWRLPAVVLHDPKREAFGAYRVLVTPSVVVVDGKGKVVHAMPGFLPRFKDILTESLLLAAGKESPEQFEQVIDPKTQDAPPETLKADRLVHLGAELTRHGLYETAEARYTEALSAQPGHVGAKLGLADLMLRQDRLTDAEPLFRSVLAANPQSTDAALGIAAVQLRRGPDGVTEAESTLKTLIEKDPSHPRARYLMGQVYERRGDSAHAAAEFKKAAELLLARQ